MEFMDILAYAFRIGAAAVGAVIGWFVTAPVAGVLSRLAFRRPVAPDVMPWLRVLGAMGLGAALFFIVSIGGYGPGPGGGPGPGKEKGAEKGKEAGGEKSPVKEGGSGDPKGKTTTTEPALARDVIQIEIRGGAVFDDRFFLLQRKEPPLDVDELKKALQALLAADKLKTARIQFVETKDSLDDWEDRYKTKLEQMTRELDLTSLPPLRYERKKK